MEGIESRSAASSSGTLNIGYDSYFLALPLSPLPKRQAYVITYDISRVQDHNVIHLENADE